jgi:hypothetical protein
MTMIYRYNEDDPQHQVLFRAFISALADRGIHFTDEQMKQWKERSYRNLLDFAEAPRHGGKYQGDVRVSFGWHSDTNPLRVQIVSPRLRNVVAGRKKLFRKPESAAEAVWELCSPKNSDEIALEQAQEALNVKSRSKWEAESKFRRTLAEFVGKSSDESMTLLACLERMGDLDPEQAQWQLRELKELRKQVEDARAAETQERKALLALQLALGK